MDTFKKTTVGRPALWEKAGLEWLAHAESAGGARVVRVVSNDSDGLVEEHIASTQPSARAARDFGARLAITHELSSGTWGCGPRGWEGPGYQGPNANLLPLSLTPHSTWGSMYATERIRPLLPDSGIRGADAQAFDDLCGRLEAGDFDTPDRPARLHGDLWSGNVLWSHDGVVLIDPSAHVGHRETDLAALALFGAPFLDDILTGYQSVHPLSPGWEGRVGLHQLSMVLMHAVVFGGSYRQHAVQIARGCLR